MAGEGFGIILVVTAVVVIGGIALVVATTDPCPNCGVRNPKGSKTCRNCGKVLS